MIRSGTVDGSKSRSQWTSNNAPTSSQATNRTGPKTIPRIRNEHRLEGEPWEPFGPTWSTQRSQISDLRSPSNRSCEQPLLQPATPATRTGLLISQATSRYYYHPSRPPSSTSSPVLSRSHRPARPAPTASVSPG
ncbi:hypothetical protein ABKN59_003842 [Abortiporus biennis]